MKIGTKSILFGVHQFLWHPITVALAWRRVYRRWPNWWETVCIFCHDLGYWGCEDMDGEEEGKLHPVIGAFLASRIIRFFSGSDPSLPERAARLCLYHSSSFARMDEQEVSALYLPDKVSVLYDPDQFYLLRAKATGEIREYIANSPIGRLGEMPGVDLDITWLVWYHIQVEKKLKHYEKIVSTTL